MTTNKSTVWKGIMKVVEFKHFNSEGKLIYQENNILNMLHASGETYILSVLFDGLAIGANYYLGLDNRTTLAADDVMADVVAVEPNTNGYAREPVGSDEFTLITNTNGNAQANSPVVTFQADGGSFGPVKNIFLCTSSSGSSGYLISSAALSGSTTVSDGDLLSLRIGMALKDCPT